MFGVLIADLPQGPSSTLRDIVLAATPSPSPSVVSSDSVSALPNWLLISLLALVALIVVAAFALAAYNLSASRSPLRRLLGRRRRPEDSALIATLATSARPSPATGTTRTTLAIVGFSLLGVAVIAVFGLSGQGVRDLRSQVVAAITTLVAAIAGFYFGTRAAQGPAGGKPTGAAPTVTGVSPPSGPVAGGGIVTVTGTGFTGASAVNFGTVAATGLAVASDTSLTVTVPPAAAPGQVDVTVTTPRGTSAVTTADQFTYT